MVAGVETEREKAVTNPNPSNPNRPTIHISNQQKAAHAEPR